MKLSRMMAMLAVSVAVAGMICPQIALAAGPNQPKPNVIDVGLLEGGVLVGQVVDAAGLPQAKVPVAISDGQRPLAVGRTDERGYFAFRGLRGGVYELAAAGGTAAYRLWAPGTAPPTAQSGALVVAGQEVVRGQIVRDTLGWLGFYACSRPLIVGGLVATAVAVPVGIHAAQREAPASP